MGDEERNGRRYPPTMQGLLQLSVANQGSTDVDPGTSSPISEERREWLTGAMESMTVNVVAKLKANLDLLRDCETELEIKEVALDDLMEWCENMDIANDFHKIGGYEVLPSLLRHTSEVLRSHTAELVAVLVQNNPYSQQQAIDIGLMPLLLELVDKDSNETVQVKAIYAVSCLTREFQPGKDAFVQNDGFSYLIRAMQSDIEKLQTKAVFLLQALCLDEQKYRDMLCDIGMIELLVALLSSEHKLFHEYLLCTLVNLVEGQTRLIAECRQSQFNLESLLRFRMEYFNGLEEYEEAQHYAEKLLEICFPSEAPDVCCR